MTEIVLVDRFQDINPQADIVERGIKLLSLDIENVLTDYGNPDVLPGVADHMEDLLVAAKGLRFALITNQKSKIFIENVVSQLPGRIGSINPNKELGLNKKPSPDMFRFVLDEMFTHVRPEQAAHVDDQVKAWWGARQAGFGAVFWTKPAGEHQHLGVKTLRPVEFGLVRPMIAAKSKMGNFRDR